MLVLYKPYKFKFSDLDIFTRSNKYTVWYNYVDIYIKVVQVSGSPNLYDGYIYNSIIAKYQQTLFKGSEYKVEVYVNERIKASRRVNTI